MFLFIPARIRQQKSRHCRVCQSLPPWSEEPPRPEKYFLFHNQIMVAVKNRNFLEIFPTLANPSMGIGSLTVKIGQFSRNVYITDATFCPVQLKQVNIWWPSFDHKNIFVKRHRFLRYGRIKMRQWWNAEFHRFSILIWWYLKNIFSLSRTFCWANDIVAC